MKKFVVLASLVTASLAMAESQTFTVDKMTCGSCVERVEKNVCGPMLKSKKLTACNVQVGTVVVEGEKVDVTGIKAAIEKAGYPVTAVAATTAATPETK